jgi:chemotaxis protein MotB
MARHTGKKRRGGHEEAHNDERWLLTYADMITLLMALFMVLFSISSVNKSKLVALQASLKDAFSGRVLPGGEALLNAGGSDKVRSSLPTPPFPSIQPAAGGAKGKAAKAAKAAAAEAKDFTKLKAAVDRVARKDGLSSQIHTTITKQGLDIRILSQPLLFASGSATPLPGSFRVLAAIGTILAQEAQHPIDVFGYTDSQPIRSAQFPSNWELSGSRASAIVRALIVTDVAPNRLTASGRAYLDPVAPNTTNAGRQLNRRVEIVLPRLFATPTATSSVPATSTATATTAAGATTATSSIPSIRPSIKP